MEHTKDQMRPVAATGTEASLGVPGQTWNTAAYATSGRFVAELATAVVELLGSGETILDVGCGDGALTEALARTGALLTGVDASATMVAAARARGLEVDHRAAAAIPFVSRFDAAFSNAALHWIPAGEQAESLVAIRRALKPGGRLVAEMGGQGNIAAIRTALRAVLGEFGVDAETAAASFFPSPAWYRALLEEAGFTVETIGVYPRPTPLPGGRQGMARWLNTFRNGVLDRLAPDDRAEALERTVQLLTPVLQDASTGEWTADYVRLRFRATRA